MAEAANVQVRLEATAARFEGQLKRAERAFSRSAGAIDKRASRTNKVLANMGRGTGSFFTSRRHIMGNVGNQLQDVIVQAQMGTNAFRILGQQGSQLAGAFGPTGAVIGTVVAGLAALAPLLLDTSAEAKTLQQHLESLADVQNDLKASHDLLKLSLDEVHKKFGDQFEAVNKLRLAMANYNLDAMRQEFEALALAAEQTLAKITIQPLKTTDIFDDQSRRDLARFAKQLEQLSEWFGVSNEEAIKLTHTFRALQEADSIDEKVRLWTDLHGLLLKFKADLENVPPEIREALRATVEFSLKFIEVQKNAAEVKAEIEKATESAGGLSVAMADVEHWTGLSAKQMADLAEAAAAAKAQFDKAFAAKSRLFSERFGGEEGLMSKEVRFTAPPVTDTQRRLAENFGKPTGRGGGGRRGGGGGGRGARGGERLLEQLRRRSEALQREFQLIGLNAEATARLNAQFDKEATVRQILEASKAKGSTLTKQEIAEANLLAEVIEQQTLAIANKEGALDRMKEAADRAADMQRELQDALQSVADTIADAVINADDFGESLKRIGFEILKMGLNGFFGKGPLGGVLGSIFSADGNVFKGGNVVPFAKGGVVDGPATFPMPNGIGVMGEAGPEAIMPLRRGRGGRLGVEMVGGGGGVTIEVHNHYDGVNSWTQTIIEQENARLKAELVREMPGVVSGAFRQRPALRR